MTKKAQYDKKLRTLKKGMWLIWIGLSLAIFIPVAYGRTTIGAVLCIIPIIVGAGMLIYSAVWAINSQRKDILEKLSNKTKQP